MHDLNFTQFFVFLFVLFYVEAIRESENPSFLLSKSSKYQKSQPNTDTIGFSSTTENVPRVNRQLDSDVESRFHISPNTIIRTGESRILGARYINETLLPSNHDCLTWCLETPNCNLAVYEEKDAQSCYMFNCGSPSESLCKFTSHTFFISSVLKITQHSYDLSQWGNQVKHEQELANLKNEEISYSSSTTVSTPKEELLTSKPPENINVSPKPVNMCHHYQFKCQNSSECIAIYNVCDGIPQCPDGSDESVELKCHEKENKVASQVKVKPPENTKVELKPPPSTNRDSSSIVRSKISQAGNLRKTPEVNRVPPMHSNSKQQEGSRHAAESKNIWPNKPVPNQGARKDYYHRSDDKTNGDADGLGSPFIHKHSQFVAANDPHVQSLNRWSNDYDQYPSRSIDQQYAPYEGNNYQRIDDQYASNQLSPDYDTVKGYNNYRQEDIPYWSNQDASFPVDEYPQSGMHNLNKQNNYPDKESLYAQQLARTAEQYPEIKHRIMHKPPDPASEPSQQNRASDIEGYKPHRVALERQQPYIIDDVLQKQLYAEMNPKSYPTRNMEDSVYNSDDLIRASLVNQLPIEMDHSNQYSSKHSGDSSMPREHEKSKESHESEKEYRKELAKDSLIIVKPTSPPPKSVQRTVLDFKMSVTELYQSSRIHSQEANSAILALIVGLVIAFLLFVFLVCRVKTIRKRMSKKGRALAHDADYLVNGMYL